MGLLLNRISIKKIVKKVSFYELEEYHKLTKLIITEEKGVLL